MQQVFRLGGIVPAQQRLLYVPPSTASAANPLASLIPHWASQMRIVVYNRFAFRTINRFIPGNVQTINNVQPIRSPSRIVRGPERVPKTPRYVPVNNVQIIRSPSRTIRGPERAPKPSRYTPGSTTISILPLPISKRIVQIPRVVVRKFFNPFPVFPMQVPVFRTKTRIVNAVRVRPDRILPMTRPTVPLILHEHRQIGRASTKQVVKMFLPTAIQRINVPVPVRANRLAIVRQFVPRTHLVAIRQPQIVLPIVGNRRQVRIPGVVKRANTVIQSAAVTRYVPIAEKTKQVRTIQRVPSRAVKVVPIRPNAVVIPIQKRQITQQFRVVARSRVIQAAPVKATVVINHNRVSRSTTTIVKHGFPFAVNKNVNVPAPFPVARIRIRPYVVVVPRRVNVASIVCPPPIVRPVIVDQKRFVR